MGYHHFSIAERGQLDALYRLKWTTRQIAVHLGRHHATIAREVRRGRQADGYHAPHAHNGAVQRRHGSCPKGKYTHRLQMKLRNAYGKHGHQLRLPPIIVGIITRQYHSKPCIDGCIACSFIQ